MIQVNIQTYIQMLMLLNKQQNVISFKYQSKCIMVQANTCRIIQNICVQNLTRRTALVRLPNNAIASKPHVFRTPPVSRNGRPTVVLIIMCGPNQIFGKATYVLLSHKDQPMLSSATEQFVQYARVSAYLDPPCNTVAAPEVLMTKHVVVAL